MNRVLIYLPIKWFIHSKLSLFVLLGNLTPPYTKPWEIVFRIKKMFLGLIYFKTDIIKMPRQTAARRIYQKQGDHAIECLFCSV